MIENFEKHWEEHRVVPNLILRIKAPKLQIDEEKLRALSIKAFCRLRRLPRRKRAAERKYWLRKIAREAIQFEPGDYRIIVGDPVEPTVQPS